MEREKQPETPLTVRALISDSQSQPTGASREGVGKQVLSPTPFLTCRDLSWVIPKGRPEMVKYVWITLLGHKQGVQVWGAEGTPLERQMEAPSTTAWQLSKTYPVLTVTSYHFHRHCPSSDDIASCLDYFASILPDHSAFCLFVCFCLFRIQQSP